MTQDKREILYSIVKEDFPLLHSEDDFIRLLNKLLYVLYPEGAKPFSPKQVRLYAKHPRDAYYNFDIKKKNGKLRHISAPVPRLKEIQECINIIFQAYYEPNEYACGFIPTKSIVDGAQQHVGQHYVLNLDMKDFFDSIGIFDLQRILKRRPFILTGEREPIAIMISNLCCYPKRVNRIIEGKQVEVIRLVTPQGAPTSPMVTNWVCRTMDARLQGLALHFSARYTRYADDITFSHFKNIFKECSTFRKFVEAIISQTSHLQINTEKTRLQGTRFRQEVTGLVVNAKVNTPKRYIGQIRRWLYYGEHYGILKADKIFKAEYHKDKGHVKKGPSEFSSVLQGKLNYLKMIKGENDPLYLKLQERANILFHPNKSQVKSDNKEKEMSPIQILQNLISMM